MVAESLPIAKWLLAQRNANGGFSSTQVCHINCKSLIKTIISHQMFLKSTPQCFIKPGRQK